MVWLPNEQGNKQDSTGDQVFLMQMQVNLICRYSVVGPIDPRLVCTRINQNMPFCCLGFLVCLMFAIQKPNHTPNTKYAQNINCIKHEKTKKAYILQCSVHLKGQKWLDGGEQPIKISTNTLEQEISTLNGEMQFCSSSTRVASHLSNNSSCNDYLGTQTCYVITH